jgi:DNA-binding Lrp family transcriptional regulator
MRDYLNSLDGVDRQLIGLLRDDARAPVSALAQRLKLSRGTIQNRLAKLEKSGVIVGYTIRLKPQAEPQRIRAWMCVSVAGNHMSTVIAALRGEPAVAALHSTNGRWDIMAEILADSLEAFDVTISRIRDVKGVADTETSILLSTHKI